MKKSVFIAAICCLSASLAFGQEGQQFSKNHLILGGSVSFDYEKTVDRDASAIVSQPETYYITQWTFAPEVYAGYFVADRLALGLKTDLILDASKGWSSVFPTKTKANYTSLEIGPFIRYYIKSGLFAEAFGSVDLVHSGYTSSSDRLKIYTEGAGIGYTWFLTQSVALEPEIKYMHMSRPSTDDYPFRESKNGVYISAGFQIFFNTTKSE
jgi:hypothetical protein